MNLLFIYFEIIVDGEGICYFIYLVGCCYYCCGCQNFEFWNLLVGILFILEKIEKMICEINVNLLLDGIIFFGGDLFYYF